MTDDTDPNMPNRSAARRVSRRNLVAGAAWTVPVVMVATAAPAFAVSGAWTITSASFEGTSGGTRNNNGEIQFRFTVTADTNAVVTAPRMTLTLADGGNGATIAGISSSGTGSVGGWSYAASGNAGASANSYRSFVFSRNDISTTVPVTLNFTLSNVSSADVTPTATAVFSSSNAVTGPNRSFDILAENDAAGYATSPHV